MVAATTGTLPHPFDPLSLEEIRSAIGIVKKAHGDVFFNVVSLHEPRKAEMTAWLGKQETPRPVRIADVVVIGPEGKVYDGLVDLAEGKITKWELLDGLQPIVRDSSPHLYDVLLTGIIDHNGRAPSSRTYLQERSQSD